MSTPEESEVDDRPWLERLGEVPAPRRPRLATALTLLAGLVCAVVGGVRLGAAGVVSGLAAALVVLAFFVSSPLPLTLTEALRAERAAGLVLLLSNYGLRVVLALVVPGLLVVSGEADRRALGLSVVVCALVRVNTQAVLARPAARSGDRAVQRPGGAG